VAEYEAKIKELLGELEQQSKRHMREVGELHDHYIGYKSKAAELQARVQMYQADQQAAL
jgi:hypothetical protein